MNITSEQAYNSLVRKNIELQSAVEELIGLAHRKADATAHYEKQLSVHILTLRDSGTSATLSEKIAKGELDKEKLEMMLAEELLKIQYVKIDAIKSHISSYQSIINGRRAEMQAMLIENNQKEK